MVFLVILSDRLILASEIIIYVLVAIMKVKNVRKQNRNYLDL